MLPTFPPPNVIRARELIGIAVGMTLAALFVAGSVVSCALVFSEVIAR